MADKKAHLPPVSLAKKEAPAPIPAVRLVSTYSLFNAIIYAIAYTHNQYDAVPCDPCVELTDAQAAKVDALWNGMMWFAAPQAAAAALALVLPCRRRWIRRALAYVALANAIFSNCMYVSAVRVVLAAEPGYLSFRIPCSIGIFGLSVGDVLGFLVSWEVRSRAGNKRTRSPWMKDQIGLLGRST